MMDMELEIARNMGADVEVLMYLAGITEEELYGDIEEEEEEA